MVYLISATDICTGRSLSLATRRAVPGVMETAPSVGEWVNPDTARPLASLRRGAEPPVTGRKHATEGNGPMIEEKERKAVRLEVDRALRYLAEELGINPGIVLAVAHARVLTSIIATFGDDAARNTLSHANEFLGGIAVKAAVTVQSAGRPN